MTGQEPTAPLDLALWAGHHLQDADGTTVGIEHVERHCERLRKSLEVLHSTLRQGAAKDRRARAAKNAQNRHGTRFEVGDFVLVACHGTAAIIAKPPKAVVCWQGPYVIVDTPTHSTTEYYVRLVGQPASVKAKLVHWQRLLRFAGRDFKCPAWLSKSANHDIHEYVVDRFLGWRHGDDGVQLQVLWRGFEQADATWEPISQLLEDVPGLVKRYLRKESRNNPALAATLKALL